MPDFAKVSQWLSDNYVVVFILVPGVIAHIMPHLSPEWQARLGKFGVLLNAISGNYRNAKNSAQIQAVTQVVAAVSSPEAVADSSAKVIDLSTGLRVVGPPNSIPGRTAGEIAAAGEARAPKNTPED